MIPAAFDYCRATSADDALAKLADFGDDARPLAGGQSLIPLMRLRLAYPSALVDLSGVHDLSYIRVDGEQLRIGAMTTHRALEASFLVQAELPLLSQIASQIGDPQVRNRGTIGGVVAHADPAAEYPMLCLMLDAEIVTSRRTCTADEFFLGQYTTALEANEIVVEIRFPLAKGPHAYLKFGHTLFDWAIVGVAVQQVSAGWRVGLANLADRPVRASSAEAALANGADAVTASELASEGLEPTPALRASPEYKLHLSRELTRRALERARR